MPSIRGFFSSLLSLVNSVAQNWLEVTPGMPSSPLLAQHICVAQTTSSFSHRCQWSDFCALQYYLFETIRHVSLGQYSGVFVVISIGLRSGSFLHAQPRILPFLLKLNATSPIHCRSPLATTSSSASEPKTPHASSLEDSLFGFEQTAAAGEPTYGSSETPSTYASAFLESISSRACSFSVKYVSRASSRSSKVTGNLEDTSCTIPGSPTPPDLPLDVALSPPSPATALCAYPSPVLTGSFNDAIPTVSSTSQCSIGHDIAPQPVPLICDITSESLLCRRSRSLPQLGRALTSLSAQCAPRHTSLPPIAHRALPGSNKYEDSISSPASPLFFPDVEATSCSDDSDGGTMERRNCMEYVDGVTFVHNCEHAYKVLGLIAEGSFGRVMAVINPEGAFVAMKVINKASGWYNRKGGRTAVLTEQRCMADATRSNSTFVVHLLSSWEDEFYVYLVMRYYNEDLGHRMWERQISAQALPICCAELIMGLQDLGNLKIIHCDLKPENIMVDGHGHLRIVDFGLAEYPPSDFVGDFDSFRVYGLRGSPAYMAPEVADSNVTTVGFTRIADVYSLGLIFLEMFWGLTQPYSIACGIHDKEKLETERYLSIDRLTESLTDSTARDLIEKMLERNPEKRLLPDDLLHHNYFKEVNLDEVRNRRADHQYENPGARYNAKQHIHTPPPVSYACSTGLPAGGDFDFYSSLDPMEDRMQGTLYWRG
ncbi:cAMP-dependent protein kinase catalytic subunit [Grifola frondosa]|uniref:cAMP-dependent protein kinase catalytic subunit n=1 Tax=Grifola frondosa TaxID=5627 RepID=A0A1C7MFA2_GRIFR|nr:cAMP-dependent protein kinase catalytic subunit [Grifola frondosa]